MTDCPLVEAAESCVNPLCLPLSSRPVLLLPLLTPTHPPSPHTERVDNRSRPVHPTALCLVLHWLDIPAAISQQRTADSGQQTADSERLHEKDPAAVIQTVVVIDV